MKKAFGDIDIDLINRDQILQHIDHIPASIIKDNKIEKHLTGVYVQQVPTDPITGYCSLDYDDAEQIGYFKLDFINMNGYRGIKDEAHLNKLLSDNIKWELFEREEIVKQLIHIHGYSNLVKQMKPTSVEQLAMLLAVIRPGKKHLQGRPWEEIAKEVWVKDNNSDYAFKKSHAISYAMAIIVQLNKIVEDLS